MEQYICSVTPEPSYCCLDRIQAALAQARGETQKSLSAILAPLSAKELATVTRAMDALHRAFAAPARPVGRFLRAPLVRFLRAHCPRGGPRPMAILELQALTRTFSTLVAVNELSLSIERGEMFALLGPNGAGKSTTIKMLTTLLKPSRGTALVDGFDIVRTPGAVRRIIGYVPQMLSADGTLTGRENLLVFARLYDLPRRDAPRTGRRGPRFHGAGRTRRRNPCASTPGGMIRRLEIAQSMLHNPRVLFLDEPTVGLDPVGTARGLGAHRGAARPHQRNDRPDDAPDGGGGCPVQPGGDHAPGEPRRPRNAAGDEGVDRKTERDPGGRLHPLYGEQS